MRTYKAMRWCYGAALGSSLLFAACAHDTYQQRADVIKQHSEAFYTHLKANRVDAGIGSYGLVVRLVTGVRFASDWSIAGR